MTNNNLSRKGEQNGMYGTHRTGDANPFYGKKHTEETKARLRKANTGKKQSKASIEKMRAKLVGRKPTWLIGKSLAEEHKKKISLSFKDRNKSIEHRKKISEAHKKLVKEGKHHLGDGTKTPLNMKIRHSVEYKLWREAVYRRDKYKCVWCGVVGGKLEADHIKSFSQFPELRFAIDNGRTLCKSCHKTTSNYGNKKIYVK